MTQQRTILITGCSSGIGLACAQGLHDRGWRVFATARRPEDLEMLAERGLEPLHMELTDPASVADCAAQVLQRTGEHVDALFNNAAYGQPGAVEDLPVELLREQFEVNVFSWHALTRALLPAMRRQGHGRIVHCSSVLGIMSPPFRGAYNASKFALEALADAMHHELAGTGIHISLIQPGPIESRFVDRALVQLRDHVDTAGSPHRDLYEARLAQLEAGGTMRFKRPATAVLEKLIHAVESPRPKRRYMVTVPTYMATVGRRALPAALWDRLVARA